ncbi:MAG: hypothetical protein B0D92_05180 [Spirochaeta sp. LUC14_002_19_P3]|nr:MAG: hypothetical protein B0D92_05180 [Spirochaeta sp. LUC14_002_19_P3]
MAMRIFAQDMAVATVRFMRTEPISGKQLGGMIENLELQQGRKLTLEEKKTVLDTLIDQMLINQAAEADRNLKVTDEEVEQAGIRVISQQLTSAGALPPGALLTDKVQYKQLIERQGITFKEFEDTVRKQLLTEKYITSRGKEKFQAIKPATEDELSAEYQKRVQEFVVSDSVWFNQVFFTTRSLSPAEAEKKRVKAEEIHRRLVNGSATFADMVASESEDEASKVRGGLIGPLMKGDELAEQLYGEDFVNTVFKLQVDVLSAVLRSKVGYHIVKITEKKAAQLLPKESPEVKNYLQQLVFAQKYQKIFDDVAIALVEDLRGRSTINYFGEYK